MLCCENCFRDKEIKGFFYSNSTQKGTCEFCQRDSVNLLDPSEMEELFLPVIRLFAPITEPALIDTSAPFLHHQLQKRWNIFESTDPVVWQKLLLSIFSRMKSPDDAIFVEPVGIPALYLDDSSDKQENQWEIFTNEIKHTNRFFLKSTIDLDRLKDLLADFAKTYNAGKYFYRGRVSDRSGLPKEKMGKPPAAKAVTGRANPEGIPYLYVSADRETTVYESRCSYLDYLTIGEFRVIDPLDVVSLRGVSEISPFVFQDRLESYIVHLRYLTRLEKELSRPLRRHDHHLDYLPTQYLCEFVKSLGYDAIEYGSALKSGGINLAIFNDEKLVATKVSLYEISSVEMKTVFVKEVEA